MKVFGTRVTLILCCIIFLFFGCREEKIAKDRAEMTAKTAAKKPPENAVAMVGQLRLVKLKDYDFMNPMIVEFESNRHVKGGIFKDKDGNEFDVRSVVDYPTDNQIEKITTETVCIAGA